MSDIWTVAAEPEYDRDYEDMPDAWGEPSVAETRYATPRRARTRGSLSDLVEAVAETPYRTPHYNLSYLARDVLDPDHARPAEDLPSVGVFETGHERYGTLMRQAFNFIRLHADRRYSDTTLMRLVRAAEGAERNPVGTRLDNMPALVAVESPTSYDEETEVKTGGITALAVNWPHNDGKTVLAVHRSFRRQKYGTLVARALIETVCGAPAYWVSARNAPGQQFLLSMGLMPTSMNGAGAVCYSYSAGEEE